MTEKRPEPWSRWKLFYWSLEIAGELRKIKTDPNVLVMEHNMFMTL